MGAKNQSKILRTFLHKQQQQADVEDPGREEPQQDPDWRRQRRHGVCQAVVHIVICSAVDPEWSTALRRRDSGARGNTVN